MGDAEISAPWATPEPGAVLCWVAPAGLQVPKARHSSVPSHGQCQGHGFSCPCTSVPAVHGGFQLGAALWFRLESGSEGTEEEDGDPTAALEPGQAGGSLVRRGGHWGAGGC